MRKQQESLKKKVLIYAILALSVIVSAEVTHVHSLKPLGFLSSSLPTPKPTTTPQTTPPKTTEEESSGGNGWSIFFAVILVILLVIGIIYAYNMYLDHIVVTEGAMKTELGIRKQELSSKQAMRLTVLTFNSKNDEFTKKFHCPEVHVKATNETVNKVSLGDYLKVEFKCTESKLILCNYPTSDKKECCYFEVELESIKQAVADGGVVSIGFIAQNKIEAVKSKIDHQDSKPNGSTVTAGTEEHYSTLLEGTDAVTFSSNGQVKLGPKSLDLGITAFAYGETMGIGYSRQTGRIWITADGEFLNPPPLEEVKKLQDEQKQAKSKSAQQAGVVEDAIPKNKDDAKIEKELEDQRKDRVLTMTVPRGKDTIEAVYPFIMANCECTIDVNVGGYPFRFNQKEIATGLLE